MFALISDFLKLKKEFENVSNKLMPKPILMISRSSEFEAVLKADSFVDKSLLIEALLQNNYPLVMITVPHQFGKSVNMDMMKRFIELEVDGNGKEKTNIMKDKYNYKLFSSVKKLQIMENKKIVETHFGKYPIIKVNFLCGHGISTYTDAVVFCQRVVHEVFRKHRYLYKSKESNLEDDEKKECEKWCHQLGYKKFGPNDTIKSLKHLSEYLHKFHGKRIFLLIDDFDSVIAKAMFETMDEQVLKKIIDLSIGMIGVVVKNNSENIMGGLITGTLNLGGLGISNLMGTMVRCQFGSEHLCMNFYGFDIIEVQDLFIKWSLDKKAIRRVIYQYAGYYNEQGRRIYNPFSIVRFLDELNLELELEYGQIEYFDGLFSVQKIREMIEQLVENKTQEGNALTSAINKDDIIKLNGLTSFWKMQPNLEIICKFLFCQGYLTYFYNKKIYINKLIIPTTEIRYILKDKLADFYMEKYQLDENKHKDCQLAFQYLFLHAAKDKATYKKALENLNMQLMLLVESAYLTSCETGMLKVISSVFLKAEYYCFNQYFLHVADNLDNIFKNMKK